MAKKPSYKISAGDENENFTININPLQSSSPYHSRNDGAVESLNENENSAGKKSCNWKDEAVKSLHRYLKKNKEKVNQRDGELKKKLWANASAFLEENGHNYTPTQCANKWKNTRQDFKVKLLTFSSFFKKKNYNSNHKFNHLIL
jgi:hypothetical protein